jgi:hypothetical protein
MRPGLCLVAAVALLALAGVASAQLGDSSFDQLDHPAIQYSTRAARDPVAALNSRIQAGDLQLSFDAGHGYLPSLLRALEIPIESQVAVFSKTSTQLNLIHPRNPRVIYFNDAASVGWIRGTFVLEVAAQDPEQGTIFYELDQQPTDRPILRRTRACLRCHHSLYTNGVPGRLMRSTPTAADGTALAWTRNLATDDRTPFDQRWGGWYVTGRTSGLSHQGNVFATSAATTVAGRSPDLDTLEGKFDTSAYLSPYSDVVALMVLEHQSHLTNLLTRLGWETRAAAYEAQAGGSIPQQPLPGRAPFSFDAAVTEIVDYLLFVDEAPLQGRVQGTSGFAEQFARRGPFDSRGRSLRQLDLERRLLRYPCSYMIYSPVFDELPAQSREAIYRRMWQILGGTERSAKYARLDDGDRAAIVQILRDTKKELPDYFR